VRHLHSRTCPRRAVRTLELEWTVLGFGILGFGVRELKFSVLSSGSSVIELSFRFVGLMVWGWGSVSGVFVWSLGLRVKGLGLRV